VFEEARMTVDALKKLRGERARRFGRRDLFRTGGMLTAFGLLGGRASSAQPMADGGNGGPPTTNIYEAIGVKPVINCRGVNTYIGGSVTLPEVKRAMDEAGRQFVDMNELANGVGQRLAQLTGAEWGTVTSGCSAAMTHATSACIAGTDPEKLQRLPDLSGLKDEVIIPRQSRNVYDHAIRMLGVKILEPETKEQYEAAFSPRTAMVYVLSGNRSGVPLDELAATARQKSVPVLVDAAAERLTVPNDYLQRGATMVCYSGGKLFRGPQCSGLLIGPKHLVRAAWYNGAPHHSFGRSMKVGKEEMMGLVTAVEMWVKRDHDAERKQMQAWCDHIAGRVAKVPGVTADTTPAEGAVAPTPRLQISWDRARIPLTSRDVYQLLLDGQPRIATAPQVGVAPDGQPESIRLSPIMLSPGEEKLVAERLYSILSRPPRIERPVSTAAPAQVAGKWSANLEFVAGSGEHTFVFEQQGEEIRGTHHSRFLSGDLRGYVQGNVIRFRSSHKYEGSYINYEFTGTVDGTRIQGRVDDMSTIDPGEFGEATWSAQRYSYTDPRGVPVRPVKSV
jgi:L-seryl-tRNA(Ser) seleniumtransferase